MSLLSLLAIGLGPADPIEIAWTLVASVGFLVQAWLLRDSYLTWTAVSTVESSNGRRRIARGHLRSGGIFISIHALFVWAGISSMIEPEVELPLTTGRAIRIVLFMTVAVLLVLVGVLDRRDRIALRLRYGGGERRRLDDEPAAG